MRPRPTVFRLSAALVALCPSLVLAQAPHASPPAGLLTPITLDEPGYLPAAEQPAPFVPAYPQSPYSAAPLPQRSPPVDVRLVAAEEPAKSPLLPGRRLLPRSDASQKSLSRPAPVSPGKTLGTVAGSLAIVLGLFAVIAWCARKAAPQATSLLPKEAVEILGRANLASRQQAQLVRVGNKLLLVAVTATETRTLTEITAPAEVEHLLALCRRGQANSASAVFLQTLTQLAEEPVTPGFLGSERSRSRGAT